MKKWYGVIFMAILMAGCDITVEDWNENKVLPLDLSLPLVDSTYTMAQLVEENPTYLHIRGDTIFFGEDTTITNRYFASDSTYNVYFSHGLPDVLDTLRSDIQSQLFEVFGIMRLKGNVISPVTVSFGLTYFKAGNPVDGDTVRISLPSGRCDTVVKVRLEYVPIGSFGVNLRGEGVLGAAWIDTLYLSYEIPAEINFRGDNLVSEEIEIEIDSSIIEFAEDGLIDTVGFYMRACNHLPMGLRLTTWVLNKERTDSAVVFNESEITPAPLNSEGFAAQETESRFQAILSREHFSYLTKDTLYIHMNVWVPSQTDVAKLRLQDYLRLSGYIRVKGYLDLEKLEEE